MAYGSTGPLPRLIPRSICYVCGIGVNDSTMATASPTSSSFSPGSDHAQVLRVVMDKADPIIAQTKQMVSNLTSRLSSVTYVVRILRLPDDLC